MTGKILKYALPARSSPHREDDTAGVLSEHSIARLTASLRLEDGRSLPSGATGAVVGIWKEGAAYEVEFQLPFHAVVTVDASGLVAA